ncbi:MAG: RluA family pseudouridine synthase [Treponema sp.]|uniref:RluA family pseudouridine synthase n=1 Tax=Treponema sp. TaxID=166 RepID=UPI0025E5450C|nr:RluA family pseudouridine synthase [Treponema sp.]MBQ9280970.1 RluA family pseudouridine synthase [Treponema sp.]
MDFTHFKAGRDDSGRRLDRLLRRFLSEENLSSIYKSLRKGLIKVDGKKCDGNFRVSEGSSIAIANILLKSDSQSQKAPDSNECQDSSLNSLVIFKNDFLLILNKPYDIPVHPTSSFKGKSLAETVQNEYQATHEMASLSFKTGPLHRLDRKTTGLLAFSQNLQGAQWFSEKIKSHEIQKVYLALLEGSLTENQIWEEKIDKSEISNEQGTRRKDSGRFHTVSVNSDEGKMAHTEVTPLSHGLFWGKDITLARVLIKTGRTHQIRAQAGFHGFPLLGDTAYGSGKIDSKKWGQDFFLHASELHFSPDNPLNLPEKISAPLPKAFENILNSI